MTWRLVPDLPSLRQERYASIILDGIAASHTTAYRVTDFSIQSNHLHFIKEAEDEEALEGGMHALAGRIVRRINRGMRRSGKLVTRYHSRALGTPREVKNALRYVINNHRHHAAAIHRFLPPDWIDPFSSGPIFDGWRRPIEVDLGPIRHVTATPHPWLRRVGWRRWGVLDFDEIPGGD